MEPKKQLTRREQQKIVKNTHTGQLPLNVGYSIGKSKAPIIHTTRKRG
jgi:hypothetical protein